MWRARIALDQGLVMLCRPPPAVEGNLTNQTIKPVSNRNGQPLGPLLRLDAVSASPVLFGELDVVIEDEQIGIVQDVEISLPRKVTRLDDSDGLADIHRPL